MKKAIVTKWKPVGAIIEEFASHKIYIEILIDCYQLPAENVCYRGYVHYFKNGKLISEDQGSHRTWNWAFDDAIKFANRVHTNNWTYPFTQNNQNHIMKETNQNFNDLAESVSNASEKIKSDGEITDIALSDEHKSNDRIYPIQLHAKTAFGDTTISGYKNIREFLKKYETA